MSLEITKALLTNHLVEISNIKSSVRDEIMSKQMSYIIFNIDNAKRMCVKYSRINDILFLWDSY
jgi:hypothetical protein